MPSADRGSPWPQASLHGFLDVAYGPDGDEVLREGLDAGGVLDERRGPEQETPLHVAVRRRRLSAVAILTEKGAPLGARTRGGKTAYAHATRRGFTEIASYLEDAGADTTLAPADRFAVAVVAGDLVTAAGILQTHPQAVRTGNPEEDRLLADVAGRASSEAVAFLLEAGADVAAPGLDGGTPLHQAAWFGQPDNARLLLEAGAPLDVFETTHGLSPIGWAVHGSRYSGGAEQRQAAYRTLVVMFIEAGCSLDDPEGRHEGAYLRLLRKYASPQVWELLPDHGEG